MKKIILIFILLSSFSVKTLFAQSESEITTTIDRKQGKANLDASKGFGDFIFGTSIKSYKNFKYVPDIHEPSKKYVSKTPVNYNGIAINSVRLEFYKNKLFSITMHVHSSQVEKLLAYCLKNFGPRGRDLSDDGTYFWRGKIKKISFYEIENGQYEVLFIDDSDLNKRMDEAMGMDMH